MNKDNKIMGQGITSHPLAHGDDQPPIKTYSKQASVLAAQADNPGIITTPEGTMTFQAGDYIVTDNPPTHAWPVRQLIFESTYVEVGTPFEPRILDGEPGLIGGVTEGLAKGGPVTDQRGFAPQGQPAVPGYAAEAKEHARRAAAAAERSQAIRDHTPSRSPSPKAAPKAVPAK